MVARLTPDQKVACSNHVGVTNIFFPLYYFSPITNQAFFCWLPFKYFSDLSSKKYSCYKTLALPPDFSCFVLFFGLCSKYYMVAERPGNTYYGDDVKGFIQEFFLGGGNVDAYIADANSKSSLSILPYMLSNCISRVPDYRVL